MNTEELIRTLEDGRRFQGYYKGEYSLIRTDKLALLTKDQKKLRQLRHETDTETPNYCSKCGTKIKTMPCDEELTYCPSCDLDHEY